MGEPTIETEIDRLYGLPLAEFTKERDALARRLRADNRRDDAATVAELRKPVLAAWVVNQLAGMAAEIAGWRTRLPERSGYGIVQAFRQALDAAVRWGDMDRNPA